MCPDGIAEHQLNVETIEMFTTGRSGRQRTKIHHIPNDFLFPSFQIRFITYSSSFWRFTGRQNPFKTSSVKRSPSAEVNEIESVQNVSLSGFDCTIAVP
jgi:hypothetical protein